jgi:hypothetical protein
VKELAKILGILSIVIFYGIAVNSAKNTSSILSVDSNVGVNFYYANSNNNPLIHTAQTGVFSISSSIYVLPTLKKVASEFSSI